MKPAVEVETVPLPLTSAGADDLLDALRREPGLYAVRASGDPGSITLHLVFRSLWDMPPATESRETWEGDLRNRASKLVDRAFGRLGLLVTVRQLSAPHLTFTDFDLAHQALDDFERAMEGHDHGSSPAPDAMHVLRTWVDTAEAAEDPISHGLRRQGRVEGDDEGRPT